jgi:hypothetical protein
MAYRWKQSTTPGQYNWTATALYSVLNAHAAAAGNVRKGVARYTGGSNGTLEGCVDSSGVNQGTTGLLVSGTFYATGVLETGPSYYTIVSTESTPYGNGYDAGETAGEASQYATDQAAVDAVKANITTDVVDLLGTVTGTLNMSLYALISGIVAAADVRKGVARYSGGDNGTLIGCVDKNGNNQGATGILDATSTFQDSGTLDETGVHHSWGIIDVDGGYHVSGIFDSGAAYHATTGLAVSEVKDGTTWDDADESHEGTYDPMAAAVFPLAANVEVAETAYGPTGAEYAGALDLAAAEAAAAAGQKVTDAAFLETNKDEIITTDTDILAQFGVTGTAASSVIVIED